MVTDEERNEIINAAVEKAMLLLPEVVGNMMQQHALMSKLNSQFYSDHPEFKDHKDCVVSVLEKIDAENPFVKYDELLEKAIPDIRERIRLVKNISLADTSSPKRDFSQLSIEAPNAANIHGEI